MANTSLADQLRKLATPQTSLLAQKKKKPSLLFDPSEAASIDRVTFYEIGISGLNELSEINDAFQEFKDNLFDETSKNFERAVETVDANNKLNSIIKKFLYLLSPYFLLKPTHKALEWLIVRFHIHEYNVDELLCLALPYHGTRLFARLIQVFDLKNSNTRWQWLYPLQKKGIPLSKMALFNHCASDVTFLRLICNMTVDAVDIYGSGASKLATLFGFYSTTIIGTIHCIPDISEDYVSCLLPSILRGLSSPYVDFTASSYMIVASMLTKTSFEDRFLGKLSEKITKVKHVSLRNNSILLLNILFQGESLNTVHLPWKAVSNLAANAVWFVAAMSDFLSSVTHTNVFYLILIRDALQNAYTNDNNDILKRFIENLVRTCRVDDTSAVKLIKIIIEESRKHCDDWSCKLVQGLEKQYPVAWDIVVSELLKDSSSDSLSQVLGFTSFTTQIQIFEKLNHPKAEIRIEAIKYIANHVEDVKIKYIENSIKARWNDDDPKVIESMFLLPETLRFCSPEITETLLLRCWLKFESGWDSLLLKIFDLLKTQNSENSTKYTILVLPFFVCSSVETLKSLLNINLPFINAIKKKMNNTSKTITISEILKLRHSLPTVKELMQVHEDLPKENVYVLTFLTLLSNAYCGGTHEEKLETIEFIFSSIFPTYFAKTKWKSSMIWEPNRIEDYYKESSKRLPREIIDLCFSTMIKYTSLPKKFTAFGWWNCNDEQLVLIATLYKYFSRCERLLDENSNNVFVWALLEKHAQSVSCKINFLCNVSIVCKDEPLVYTASFRAINATLKHSEESYAWTLNLSGDNVVVPAILTGLYSLDLDLRSNAVETVGILSSSLGVALSDKLTFAQFLKYLHEYGEEIIQDREQLPSRIFTFLSQDDDVQSLLPVTVRCCTRPILDTLLDCITGEQTPTGVATSLLSTLEYLKDATVIRRLIPLASRIISSCDYPNADDSFIIRAIVDKFNTNECQIFELEDVVKFIDLCLQNSARIRIRSEHGVSCLGAILIGKLSVDIYDGLKTDMQSYLLEATLKMCCTSDNIDLISAANGFIKKVTLNCELALPYLTNMLKMPTVNKTHEKMEVNDNEMEKAVDRLEWTTGLALLERIQNKKKLTNCHVLVPALFDVLQKCCEMDDRLPMEYAKQVCLSCILNCAQKLTHERFKADDLEKMFNVELIVNCIRMSPNPQTHHHALILLAHCATFAPTQVLHNVMAIFTFMGSSVLRQDDAFSFQIISNILETIVPLLVANGDGQCSTKWPAMAVLKVFAVSIPDIPDHRQLPLLVKLMKILGEREYTHALVILAMECGAKTLAANKANVSKRMEVLHGLLLLLPIQVSLECFQKVLSFVNTLPHSIDEAKNGWSEHEQLLDLKKMTTRELCSLKYLLLNFVSTVLSGKKFVQQISSLDIDRVRSLESHFEGIIEQSLLYLKSITDYSASSKIASAKYWKDMISQTLDILYKTNALLTCETFVRVIRTLLNHECMLVQRKCMQLLNGRIQQAKENDTSDDFNPKDLITLVTPLMKIISTVTDDSDDISLDLKLNQQIAFLSIELLTRFTNTTKFMERATKVLAKLSTLLVEKTRINDHVLASLVLCVAELTSSLKIRAIESLPKFFPAILSLFKRYENQDIPQHVLWSIIVTVQKIIETLPNFLSPYLETILFEITRWTARVQRDESKEEKLDDLKYSNVAHKLKLIRQKIAAEVPARVLLPSIASTFTSLCETRNFDSIKPLLDILVDSFPKNSQFSPELTTLFLTVLDFRCTVQKLSDEEIYLVEQYSIDALCNIVLKCSETTFRPFYHKLYDWGVVTSKEESKRERILTYYRILYSLSEHLKSIFVLFAANFVRNAVELLNLYHVSTDTSSTKKIYFRDPCKVVLLVDNILKTLHNVFKYDTVKFLSKDRFNLLLEPLVNQIENTIGHYKERSDDVIIPCLARFGAATSDDSLWKQFNYLVLLKTRHSSPEIRLTALETMCAFATHLGDNFLPFLPETVPFLAELLEDENELVEKQTHKAVQRLEQILEEPIQKYF